LYSARHAAIARWKAIYMTAERGSAQWLEGAATIAALCGHATDVTATQHYARARASSGPSANLPVPMAHSKEVARIRPLLENQVVKLASLRARNTNSNADKVQFGIKRDG
jgi:hypothetical protein